MSKSSSAFKNGIRVRIFWTGKDCSFLMLYTKAVQMRRDRVKAIDDVEMKGVIESKTSQ